MSKTWIHVFKAWLLDMHHTVIWMQNITIQEVFSEKSSLLEYNYYTPPPLQFILYWVYQINGWSIGDLVHLPINTDR